MNRLNVLFLITVCVLLLNACDDDTFNGKEYKAQIVEADLPETGTVNTPIRFTIRFGARNGCQYFSREKTTIIGNKVAVTLFAIDNSEGRVCTQAAIPVPVEYTFTPLQKGVYMFYFNTGNGYLTDTITID